MTENNQDTLARAFATLSSLQNNINQMTDNRILEKYVNEYHTVLDSLEGIGENVSEFRIPDSEITPRVTVIRTLTFSNEPKSGADYSKEKYVDKSFILTKLDAILGYFEIITSDKPRRIGFRKDDTDN